MYAWWLKKSGKVDNPNTYNGFRRNISFFIKGKNFFWLKNKYWGFFFLSFFFYISAFAEIDKNDDKNIKIFSV